MKGIREFKERVATDPLFAAEGLDLDNARNALKELHSSLGLIARIWRTNFAARLFFLRYPPEESAHPIRFLEALLESEAQRRIFLETSTPESAARLLTCWEHAAIAYQTGIAAYLEALLRLQKMENIKDASRLGYFDVAPTFSELTAWVRLMQDNGQRLTQEIAARRAILRDGAEAIPEKPKGITSSAVSNSDEKPDVILSDELRELFGIAGMQNARERIGPIVYAARQFDDGQNTPHAFFASVGQTRAVHSPQIEVFLADEYFFLNLKKGHFLDLVIYRPLIEAGLDYWCQPATSFYATLDLTYYADIATAADCERRPHPRRNFVLDQRSSVLDLLIGRGIHYNTRFAELLAIFAFHKRLPPLSFFYIARAYPSLYFLPFNRSVWRINQSPTLQASRFSPRSHYETFSDLRTRVPLDTIKKIVGISAKRMSRFANELARFNMNKSTTL